MQHIHHAINERETTMNAYIHELAKLSNMMLLKINSFYAYYVPRKNEKNKIIYNSISHNISNLF